MSLYSRDPQHSTSLMELGRTAEGEWLSSTKLVPGAKKVGGLCSMALCGIAEVWKHVPVNKKKRVHPHRGVLYRRQKECAAKNPCDLSTPTLTPSRHLQFSSDTNPQN